MPLSDRLKALRDNASEHERTFYDALVRHLIETGAVEDALKTGDKFPEFQLASADGRLVRSQEILARGPAVFSFYRGAWCPYCSAELAALAEIAPEIRDAGANLVAITPEAGGTALRTRVDRGLNFEILCDLDNTLAMECGLVFRIPDDLRRAYLAAGRDLSKVYGNESWLLPTPATYVVRQDGVIAHAYVNPDFRYRPEPGEILSVLSRLRR